MLLIAICAVTSVLVLIYVVILRYSGSSKTSTIPGLDPSDPKDGNYADIKSAGSLHEFLMDLHGQFGDIASFWMGTQFTVSIASPKLFSEHTRVFDRPPQLFEQFAAMITDESIQFANGIDGRGRRNMYDRSYSHESVSKYYSVLQKVVDELVVKLLSVASDDHLPLQQYMFALAIKAIAKISFGDYFDDDKKVLEMHRSYEVCWSEMERRLVHGDVDPDKNSSRQKRFDKALQTVNKMFKEIVEMGRQRTKSEDDTMLIDMMMESGASMERIQADCISYMVGGFHTTGNLLTWCMYFLAGHPDIQDKVHAELKDILDGDNVTLESAKHLVYTRQVIDETLRCSVLAPWAARFQDMDVELGGHIIPKNTPVVHALGVVLQDETLWPDPNKFDPDRFSKENKKARPNFSFEPFGFAGKRKCPGYRLAYTEATIWLATLLQKFEFKLVDGQVITPVFGLVTNPVDEIWVTVNPRK